MSLNGLDDPKVREAHEVAVGEPGGWFLLKYASRDEVELMGRGNGGIVEVRDNVAGYDESPLYGFLRYRRRNVLIKYMPENCSRIIQARVAVHFNAVCDFFSPFDTMFEITEAKELKDTKLSAACSLHAASGSNSSSTSSLRRRRLMEIAEEDEEEQRATKRQSMVNEDEDRPSTATEPTAPVTLNSELAASPEQRKFTAGETSEVPNFVGADERPLSPVDSVDATYNSYPYGKPKVKLAPRPSLDVNGKPRTSASYRPVSQIPAGFKFFGKGSKKGKGKDDSETASIQEELADASLSASIPVPEGSQAADESARPSTSSGVSTNSTIMPAPTKPTITPEKARLMKAMKLREKKKMMSAQLSEHAADPTLLDVGRIEAEAEAETERRLSISNADSGIVLDPSCSSMNTDQASEITRTDSHPGSPVIASSEPDHSTKASSLSESTDETVQDKTEDPEVKHENEQPVSDEVKGSEEESPAAEDTPTTTPIDHAVTLDANPDSSSIPTEPQSRPEVLSAAETATSQTPETLDMKTAEAPAPTNKTDEPATPTSPRLKIPKSKFSTQDLRSAARSASNSPEVRAKEAVPEEPPAATAEEPKDKEKNGTETTEPNEKPNKRKVSVDPIRTDLTHSRGVSRSEDDEALLEELHSATVEEAKSMLVSKSPVTPVFPSPTKSRPTTSNGTSQALRAVSNPVGGTLRVPTDAAPGSARSVSSGSGLLNSVSPQSVAAKKPINTGSSISQRIKALEKFSGSAGEVAAAAAAGRDRPSSAFFTVKKGREPSRSPSVVDRANTIRSRHGQAPPPAPPTLEESPEISTQTGRERSGSVASRLSVFEMAPGEGQSQPSEHAQRGRPESISVTAKIVRDPNQNMQQTLEPPKDPSEYNHLELKQSPLLVDHQVSARPPSTPNSMVEESPKGTPLEGPGPSSPDLGRDDNGRRSSINFMRDFIKERRKSITSPSNEALVAPSSSHSSRSPTRPPSTQHNTPFGGRLSSRRSSLSRDKAMSPSATTEASPSGDESKSNGDKKESRAGRFMRRLSNLSGGGSRNKVTSPSGISPAVTEEEAPGPATTNSAPTIEADMGDVNVQFPDNLLWKRRNLCLDSQGFMILSALPAQSSRTAVGTKRYHLSEFRQPYIPDMEVQELPNSIVLDFTEGSGIQVACEDRAGQTKVLQTLRDAHTSHASTFGQ